MLLPVDSIEIEVAETSQLLAEDSGIDIRLVDCREEDEFTICRISGAELIPLSRFTEEGREKLLADQTRPVIIYCHHGMRSLQATNYLRQLGHEQVWSMVGGINAWSNEIDPMVPKY